MAAISGPDDLLRRFEQVQTKTVENDPAKMGQDRIMFGDGSRKTLTFEKAYDDKTWVHFLLARKSGGASTSSHQDRFLRYVEWRVTQHYVNIQYVPRDPKDEDENHKTRSSASNPTTKKVPTDQTAETPPTRPSSDPKVPTVQTVLIESEEEDDRDWEPYMNAREITEMERKIVVSARNLERVLCHHRTENNERFYKIEKMLAEILHVLSTFHNISTN
jgi:hypothetical protein